MLNFFYMLIIYPLISIIEVAFMLFSRFFKNPGMAVFGVSLTVSLLCLPLYIIAERWQEMERNTEKKLKPGIERIKKTFKGDEQYMILAAYYRQHHYHPVMALRSSFGLLIQIPFFIAAYIFLSNLPLLQGYHFLFINDMGKPDALFHIGSFPVNVLPIMMTLINIIAGAVYTKGLPGKEKIQIYGMAGLFLVLLYSSPSGLVLYWTLNNVFSLIKNIFYKVKNPLKTLYFTMCLLIALADIYLIGVSKGSIKIRLLCAGVISLAVFIPLLVRFVNYLLNTVFQPLYSDRRLRIRIFILSAVSMALLTGIVLPSSLISSSIQEFSDIDGHASPLYFLYISLVQSAGLFIFWPLCIYFLFHDRIQTLIAVLFPLMLFTGIINAYCFTGNYGTMNQTLTFISAFQQQTKTFEFCNIAAVLATLLLLFILIAVKPKIIPTLSAITLISFTAFSCISMYTIKKDYITYRNTIADSTNPTASLSPIFHLSKTGKNVIVIMLDRGESSFVDHIFNEKPELYDVYSGFTYYKNTVSFGGHTIIGAPPLFGGYEYTPHEINKPSEKTRIQRNNEALLVMPRIFSEQAGYSTVITDCPWANYSVIPDISIAAPYPAIKAYNTMRTYTPLWIKNNPDKYRETHQMSKAMERNFVWVSFFRESPAVLRHFIYYDGCWWGTNDVTDIHTLLDSYSVLDYLPSLTDFAPSKSDTFTYIVNDITHSYDLLQAPDYVPAKKVDNSGFGAYSNEYHYCDNAAGFRLLGKWFLYLKQNGVYDNTRIIIVSDHGAGTKLAESDGLQDGTFINGHMKNELHPLLFEKDFNASGRMKTDMTFCTTADVPSMAAEGLLSHPFNPFTGKQLSEDLKKSGAIVTTCGAHEPYNHKNPYKFTIADKDWFIVKDSIYDDDNWKPYKPDVGK